MHLCPSESECDVFNGAQPWEVRDVMLDRCPRVVCARSRRLEKMKKHYLGTTDYTILQHTQ